MLRLRVDVLQSEREQLVEELICLDGVRRITSDPELHGGQFMISADVEPAAADNVLDVLHGLDLHHDDYVLVREEVLTRGVNPGGLTASGGYSWVEILGEARANARPVARYFLLMAVAGWIAGLGVIQSSTILIVGAMAVSPDLMPICSTCVGIVGRRMRLAGSSFLTLVLGVGTVMLVACIVTLALQLFGILDGNFDVREVELQGLAEADYTTGLIALGAGVAAMLSFETRGQSAVGVAISVTTVPAAAFFGAAIALGEITQAWGALLVLGINLVLLVIGGSITLFCQRQFTPVHRK
ncbi:MAG: DUF389 domain-containing protein [Solirubrobacterales bacterium]|nr:DUF389 domain-containing protein [Solirubrobacterales bacterium]MCB0860333.1 DUF389 domain-containing protein [Solirubrobacterales bacterium]